MCKFKNEELFNLIINLPNNKDYKREKIRKIDIICDEPREFNFSLETAFATYAIDIFIEDNGGYAIGGNIYETAYLDVDEQLYQSYNQNTVNEFLLDIQPNTNSKIVVDEIISQMDQDSWKIKFKLLYKVYNSMEKFREECAEEGIEGLFKELLTNYSR